MLRQENFQKLRELIDTVSTEELIWINGYLSGMVSEEKKPDRIQSNQVRPASSIQNKISLVYGTETGNSKKLAMQLATEARKKGIRMKLSSLDEYRLSDLEQEEYLFVVISTQGEGEPPAQARKWYDHIHRNGFVLPRLKFGVLALGDSAYPLYCRTGEDVDRQLEKLGGKRVVGLQKCDTDYQEDANRWFEEVLKSLNANMTPENASDLRERVVSKKEQVKKFRGGAILKNINLNDRGSARETYHLEIGVEEYTEYEPGDALAVIPENRQEIVDRILEKTGINPDKIITTSKATGKVRDLLTRSLNICYLLSSTVRKYALITGHDIPDTRADLFDLVQQYPVRNPDQFEEIIQILLPVSPRLYSISSSPAAHPGEIHLTVAKNRFSVNEEIRNGLCSEFLGRYPVNTNLSFYIHPNRSFRLPAPDKDIILIGPGTGIAPFRSFLAERDASGATGRNWLFFGEQRFQTDFLYQTELQQFLQTGVLTKLSLAFSRDQPEKIYVQHRMLENAAELCSWLETGSYVYISGNKNPMSFEVEKTWMKIIQEQGKKSTEEAQQYWEELKKQGRYQKDVY